MRIKNYIISHKGFLPTIYRRQKKRNSLNYLQTFLKLLFKLTIKLFKMHTKITHKTRWYLVGLFAVSVMLLSGCESENPANTTPPTQGTQTVEQSNTSEVKEMPTKPAVSEADQLAFSSALDLMDPTFCDKITDEDTKSSCKKSIEDKKIYRDASQKMDKSLCSGISTEDGKKTCEIQIDYLTAQKKKEEDFQAQNDKVNEVIKTGNIEGCKAITDNNMRAGCEFNILINKGQTKGEGAAICAAASTEETKKRCLDYYDALPEKLEQNTPVS